MVFLVTILLGTKPLVGGPEGYGTIPRPRVSYAALWLYTAVHLACHKKHAA